jgi:hypothetical protein
MQSSLLLPPQQQQQLVPAVLLLLHVVPRTEPQVPAVLAAEV